MKTVRVQLSKQIIAQYEGVNVQLCDTRAPSLIFRYSKKRSAVGFFHCRITKNKYSSSKGIGPYPLVDIAAARLAVNRILTNAVEEKYEVLKCKKFEKVGELLRWYLEFRLAQQNLKAATERNLHHQITTVLHPILEEWDISQLTAGRLAEEWLIPSYQQYKVATLRGAFQCFKAAFNQAIRLEYLLVNPIHTVSFSHLTPAKVSQRKSKIEQYSLKRLVRWLSSFPEPQKVFCLLCLGFLTRNQETALTRWQDIDFERAIWHIPASNTKTGQEITHPLSPEIVKMLKEYKAWQRARKRSVFLFPQKRGIKNMTASQISHRIYSLSQGGLRLHDLRKYGSSYLREMGTDYYIVERILNHRKTTLDATYIHTSMMEIIKSALFEWHSEIYKWRCA